MSARFLFTCAAVLVFASCSAKVNERPILAAEASGTSSEGGADASTANASSGSDTGTPAASGSDGNGLSSSGALDGASIATAPSDGGSFSPCSDSDGGCSVWTGYLENYHLMSGSDVVTLEMQLPQGPFFGTVRGSVVFGQGPLLAPPTDPNVGYPPDPQPSDCVLNGHYGADFQEHFAFSMVQGTFDGTRLTFSLEANEIFKQWCELQTVIFPIPPSEYNCVPLRPTACNPDSGGTLTDSGYTVIPECYLDPTTGKLVPIDCGKGFLCYGRYCACTSTHCTNAATAPMITFDMQVQPDRADGSVSFSPSSIINVHLTRQAAGD